MIEDSTLLRDYAANRTEGAFAELVRRHLDLVYSAAMRRTNGNFHQAQDIAQLVFNELARKAENVAGHPTLAGWLHTATRNAAVNVARAERRRRRHETEASTMNEILSSPANDAEWARLRPVLDEVIDHLPQSDRDAVVLRFLEGRPFAEIGEAFRISEDAARMRVDRALERMRRLLARRGITATAALSLGLAGSTAIAAPGGMAASVTSAALTHAASTGSAGIVATLWAWTTGTKLAVGTTVAVVLGIAGITAFNLEKGTGEPGRSSASAAAINPPTRVPTPPATPSLPSAPPANSDPQAAMMPRNSTQATARQRERMLRLYAPLFEHLALTPAQRERLLTLLVAEFEVATDFAAAASAAGVEATADAASFDVAVRLLREKIWGEIGALLGEGGYAEYRRVRQNLRADSWASGLEKRLEVTAAPMSPEQSRQLRVLLNEEGREPNDPSTLVKAGSFLFPDQMAVLRELHAERIAGAQSPKVQAAVRESTAQKPSNP